MTTSDELRQLYLRAWRRGKVEGGNASTTEDWSEIEILAALHRLILKERRNAFQSIVVTAKEHSDVTIQADGWPIMTRIRQLDAEIEGSNHG